MSNTVPRFQVGLRTLLVGMIGGAVVCIVVPPVIRLFFGRTGTT